MASILSRYGCSAIQIAACAAVLFCSVVAAAQDPVCGNGIQEVDESCDEGGDTAACDANCTLAICGDGYVNAAASENCDDASHNGEPNRCDADCFAVTVPVCGNGVVEAGEECEPPSSEFLRSGVRDSRVRERNLYGN